MDASLDDVIACQARLLEALDARAVDTVEIETKTLARLLSSLSDGSMSREGLELALKQTEAARIRVNIMADWTRQRIDRLAELRGNADGRPAGTYAKPRIFNATA